MFGFIKKMFFTAMTFFSCNKLNAILLKCFSINNQECKVIPEININSNEVSLYPCSIFVHKRSGSCNNINDPYAKSCVSDVIKNRNVIVFNLMSITNEKLHISFSSWWRIVKKYNEIWIGLVIY